MFIVIFVHYHLSSTAQCHTRSNILPKKVLKVSGTEVMKSLRNLEYWDRVKTCIVIVKIYLYSFPHLHFVPSTGVSGGYHILFLSHWTCGNQCRRLEEAFATRLKA